MNGGGECDLAKLHAQMRKGGVDEFEFSHWMRVTIGDYLFLTKFHALSLILHGVQCAQAAMTTKTTDTRFRLGSFIVVLSPCY